MLCNRLIGLFECRKKRQMNIHDIYKGEQGWLTLLRIISGARYSGVPHSVQVRPFTRFAKPKSVT